MLMHHAREPLEMEGGTTFNLATEGIESTLVQANDAARDATSGSRVARRWSPSTWPCGWVDEVDASIAPLILGAGARLFEELGRETLNLDQIRAVDASGVTHIKYEAG